MNEAEFKKHLKALVAGRHHPEEHDWATDARPAGKSTHASSAKGRAPRKNSRKK